MGRKIVISFNLQKYVEKVRFGAARSKCTGKH